MFSLSIILFIIIGYVLFLYFTARYVENNFSKFKKLVLNPYVYSLSLAVYCTSWTYYGSVGSASRSGLLFITIYLGPTIMLMLSPILFKKLIKINKAYRFTSLVDLISYRYGKDPRMGYFISGAILFGILPYIAVQLKAIFKTISLVSNTLAGEALTESLLLVLLVFFTITIGIRKQDPTERHPGMIFTLALECLIKFIAFVSVGLFTVYFLNDGVVDIVDKIDQLSIANNHHFFGSKGHGDYLTYLVYMVIASIAFILLPRQYHVAIVELTDENFLKKAKWLFPLYVFIITLFVLPVAFTGLNLGLPAESADFFVLQLPMISDQKSLTLLTFIGGFSAAFGMILVSTTTLSTIVTNHIVLPVTKSVSLSKNVLQVKWVVSIVLILTSYIYLKSFGHRFNLISLGMIAFVAILQLAPVTFGGIYWKKANKHGAFVGLCLGYFIWAYTLIFPSFINAGFFDLSILTHGPFGLAIFKPEALLYIKGLNPFVHTFLFSMTLNILGFIFGSLFCKSTAANEIIANDIVNISTKQSDEKVSHEQLANILGNENALRPKELIMENIINNYLPQLDAKDVVENLKKELNLVGVKKVTTVDLVYFIDKFEAFILGSFGLIMAQEIIQKSGLLTGEERSLALKEANSLLSKSQSELEDQKNKTLQASRLSALGEMAGSIAHEINNPITVIKALAQIMVKKQAKGKLEEDFLKESLNDILATTLKIDGIIQGMKNISSDNSGGEMIESDLSAVLTDCLSISKTKLSLKNIKIEINLDNPVFHEPIQCYHTKLAQVFINLINNASHALESKKVKSISIDAKIVLDKIVVTFKDSGDGIPFEIQNKMFEPFFSSKELGEGTGLGLSLSKRFLKEHNGDLYYDTNATQTTFIVELPLNKEA